MPTISQGSEQILNLAADEAYQVSVSDGGDAYVDLLSGAPGAPFASPRLNGPTGTKIFGPYGVPARIRIRSVAGVATYSPFVQPEAVTREGSTLSGASAGAVIGTAGASPANPTAAMGDSITHQNNYKTTPSAISVSSSVVTLTVNAHGQATGNGIRITGYTQTEFNGDFTLTRIDANNISYTLAQAPTTTTPSGTGYVAFSTLAANNGYLNHANASWAAG